MKNRIESFDEFIINESNMDMLIIGECIFAILSMGWIYSIHGTDKNVPDLLNPLLWKQKILKWLDDGKIKKIVSRIKDDPDIKTFLSLPKESQKGQWQKLIGSKLTEEELKYVKQIYKKHFEIDK